MTEKKNGRRQPIIYHKYGKIIDKGNFDPFFWNILENMLFWHLSIVDKSYLQTWKESLVKNDF